MRSFLIFSLLLFMILSLIILFPAHIQAQYLGLNTWWGFRLASQFPYWLNGPKYMNPFPIYPRGYYGTPFPPLTLYSPVMAEPVFRIANAPLTLALPAATTTSPPLTAILNVIDTSLLAGNIAYLTGNYPLIYDLLVTTFSLPI